MSTPESWPPGTYAVASSTHADDGDVTFNPDNAIDLNQTTKWNDDSFGDFPDALLITPGESLNLSGIILVSAQDGFVTDFGVRVSDDPNMRYNMADVPIIANKTGIGDIQTTLNFSETVLCALLEIDVFAASTDDFSRIHEVYPIYAVSSISTTASSATSSATASPTRASAVPASPTSTSNPDSGGGGGTNTGAIAGGVVGGVGALLLIILAFWLVRRRKKKQAPTAAELSAEEYRRELEHRPIHELY